MRNQPAFYTVLGLYRALSLIIGTLLVLAIVLAALVLGELPPRSVPLLLALLLLLLLALGLLRYSHFAMKRALGRAEVDKNALLAFANRDALTGAFSRSYFLSLLRQSVYHGSSTALVYMQVDMDNLKALNDGNGHAAGDAALIHLAATIRRLAPDAIIGRLGGDEFGVAFRGQDSKAALKRLGNQMLAELGEPTQIGGRPTRVTATIGVAAAPQDASHVDDLISKADLALYQGKRAGRNMVKVFDPDMLGDERHKRFVERDLRAAILMGDLELFYQPIFAADAKTLRSYEALLRWHHSVRGMIPPSDFIAIAEQSDLIDKLGEWVTRRACLDLPELGVAVSVNVSAVQLRRPEFATRFAEILTETGTCGDRLIVEITETVPLAAGAVECANLDALRALGVRVAIDDFGAGHASLQYLRGLSFDILKVDRSYVANVATSRVDGIIVAAICTIARTIDVEVVAEGVETPAQLAALQAAGCAAFQGFLLGRPMPLRQVVRAIPGPRSRQEVPTAA